MKVVFSQPAANFKALYRAADSKFTSDQDAIIKNVKTVMEQKTPLTNENITLLKYLEKNGYDVLLAPGKTDKDINLSISDETHLIIDGSTEDSITSSDEDSLFIGNLGLNNSDSETINKQVKKAIRNSKIWDSMFYIMLGALLTVSVISLVKCTADKIHKINSNKKEIPHIDTREPAKTAFIDFSKAAKKVFK